MHIKQVIHNIFKWLVYLFEMISSVVEIAVKLVIPVR